MAILRSKEISKMKDVEIEGKIKDLKVQLLKERVEAGKGGSIKIKEMKKTIARLKTFSRLNKGSIESK